MWILSWLFCSLAFASGYWLGFRKCEDKWLDCRVEPVHVPCEQERDYLGRCDPVDDGSYHDKKEQRLLDEEKYP